MSGQTARAGDEFADDALFNYLVGGTPSAVRCSDGQPRAPRLRSCEILIIIQPDRVRVQGIVRARRCAFPVRADNGSQRQAVIDVLYAS
jgi:hypothetical protein